MPSGSAMPYSGTVPLLGCNVSKLAKLVFPTDAWTLIFGPVHWHAARDLILRAKPYWTIFPNCTHITGTPYICRPSKARAKPIRTFITRPVHEKNLQQLQLQLDGKHYAHYHSAG